jgi:acetoin utilization deacetylase AcuC-like enzyme
MSHRHRECVLNTALISHNECELHDMGAMHPECPQRLAAVRDQMIASGLHDHLLHVEAPLATREQLARVHEAGYIDSIEERAPRSGIIHLDPDTAMCPDSLNAVRRAAGAGVRATDLVMEGKVKNAFCNVRPPGHHAERARAMGFCIFNSIAVAAAHALEQHGLARVAIVDFDVHHGNGTEEIFCDDERVMMVSTFQHPFYPYSGTEGRSARMVNIPLTARSGGREFRAAVEQQWLPALEAFKPEMYFVSAGFDAHRDDELAMLQFVEADYTWISQVLMQLADRHAQGRIVSMLEGGYNLDALGRSATAHLKVLAGL